MYICHIVPSRSGKIPIFVSRQISSLEKIGLKGTIIQFDVTKFSLRYILTLYRNIKNVALKNEKVIIHGHWGSLLSLVCILIAPRQSKIIITFRGSDINRSPFDPLLQSVTRRIFSNVAANFADKIILVNEQLASSFFLKPTNYSVVLDGVDTDVFFPINQKEARAKLGWDNCKIFLFFYAGTQPEVKGINLIETSFEMVQKVFGEQIELVIVNEGVSAKRMNLMLNGSDLLLFASPFEGSPNIIREAITTGLRVVSVDVADCKKWITLTGHGMIVDYKSSEFADAILCMLKKKRKTKENIEKFLQEVSLDVSAEKLKNIYYELENND